MNKELIFAGLGGCALGSVVTFFMTKLVLNSKFEQELDEIRADYDERVEFDVKKGVIEELSKAYKAQEEDENDILEERNTISKLTDKKKKPVEVDKKDYSAKGKEKKTQINKLLSEKCQIIDLQQFSEDENGYDKLSYGVFKGVTGYTFINLDTDREDLNISGILDLKLVKENDDCNSLYIRNDMKKKDFELIMHDCTYSQWLLEEGDV